MESGYIDTDKKVFHLFRIIELGYDTYEINFLNIPAKFRISLNFGMKNRIRLIYIGSISRNCFRMLKIFSLFHFKLY